MSLESIKDKIKKKPELSGLDDSLIIDTLNEYISKNKISIENLSSKDEKLIITDVRAKLRTFSGQFQRKTKERLALSNSKNWSEILRTHTSTKERLDFYPKLDKLISSLNPKSILDLGCGLNPLAIAKPSIKYYASDIRADELEIISSFFKNNGIDGETFVFDLRKDPSNLPQTDLALIFKVLDIIEEKSHKISKNLILALKCKNILVSFPTKKLSGKKMNFPKRIWFENFLKRESLSFETIYSENEVFYLIKKS